jgi:hypothetical protein
LERKIYRVDARSAGSVNCSIERANTGLSIEFPADAAKNSAILRAPALPSGIRLGLIPRLKLLSGVWGYPSESL